MTTITTLPAKTPVDDQRLRDACVTACRDAGLRPTARRLRRLADLAYGSTRPHAPSAYHDLTDELHVPGEPAGRCRELADRLRTASVLVEREMSERGTLSR